MIVGFALPLCSTGHKDFVVTAPAPFLATSRQLEAVIPQMPEANTVGFLKEIPRMAWERFTEKAYSF